MSVFQDKLAEGVIGEGIIARWLRARGHCVLPAYEKVIDDQKGPRLYTPSQKLVAPDMLVFRGGNQLWIEAKTKTRFSWYARGGYFVTGINERHFLDYVEVERETGLSVWLLFLHRYADTWAVDVQKWGAPALCPTGLYACSLSTAESHRANDGRGVPMIYWAFSVLRKLADLVDL